MTDPNNNGKGRVTTQEFYRELMKQNAERAHMEDRLRKHFDDGLARVEARIDDGMKSLSDRMETWRDKFITQTAMDAHNEAGHKDIRERMITEREVDDKIEIVRQEFVLTKRIVYGAAGVVLLSFFVVLVSIAIATP